MGSNKKTRDELIKLFGDKCWVDKLDLKPRSIIGDYKGKSIKRLKKDKLLVYHHIIMKKDGGKTTISNGALMSEENHVWFHQQKQWKQDIMNNYFQQYKINCILANFDDELAVKLTKAQIDFCELDDEYIDFGYDNEPYLLNEEVFKIAIADKEKLNKKDDKDEMDH